MQLDINDVNEGILQEAMETLARLEGLRLTTTIDDYYGKKIEVFIGVKSQKIQRGYGVNIKSGALSIVGDDFSQGMRLSEFKTSVNQVYKAVVYSRALSRQGFRPAVTQQQGIFQVVGQR